MVSAAGAVELWGGRAELNEMKRPPVARADCPCTSRRAARSFHRRVPLPLLQHLAQSLPLQTQVRPTYRIRPLTWMVLSTSGWASKWPMALRTRVSTSRRRPVSACSAVRASTLAAGLAARCTAAHSGSRSASRCGTVPMFWGSCAELSRALEPSPAVDRRSCQQRGLLPLVSLPTWLQVLKFWSPGAMACVPPASHLQPALEDGSSSCQHMLPTSTGSCAPCNQKRQGRSTLPMPPPVLRAPR